MHKLDTELNAVLQNTTNYYGQVYLEKKNAQISVAAPNLKINTFILI